MGTSLTFAGSRGAVPLPAVPVYPEGSVPMQQLFSAASNPIPWSANGGFMSQAVPCASVPPPMLCDWFAQAWMHRMQSAPAQSLQANVPPAQASVQAQFPQFTHWLPPRSDNPMDCLNVQTGQTASGSGSAIGSS